MGYSYLGQGATSVRGSAVRIRWYVRSGLRDVTGPPALEIRGSVGPAWGGRVQRGRPRDLPCDVIRRQGVSCSLRPRQALVSVGGESVYAFGISVMVFSRGYMKLGVPSGGGARNFGRPIWGIDSVELFWKIGRWSAGFLAPAAGRLGGTREPPPKPSSITPNPQCSIVLDKASPYPRKSA